MGILDEIKARMGFEARDDEQYDEAHDTEDSFAEYDSGVSPVRSTSARQHHEAESVKVVGRGAHDDSAGVTDFEKGFTSIPRGPVPAARRGAYSTPTTYAGTPARAGSRAAAQSLRLEDYYISDAEQRDEIRHIEREGVQHKSRGKMVVSSPTSYTEVEELITALRDKNAPTVLVLAKTRAEVGKRIMDFSFGLISGLGGTIERLSPKVFVLLPADVDLSEDELLELVDKGVVERA